MTTVTDLRSPLPVVDGDVLATITAEYLHRVGLRLESSEAEAVIEFSCFLADVKANVVSDGFYTGKN